MEKRGHILALTCSNRSVEFVGRDTLSRIDRSLTGNDHSEVNQKSYRWNSWLQSHTLGDSRIHWSLREFVGKLRGGYPRALSSPRHTHEGVRQREACLKIYLRIAEREGG
ncbi:unnamed protein product [Cuscuta epithymum]|uniref:Uncharacterized protein n=1 Tax=Cuscuta epithymum TaxID=186058 RepID=A0AAV0DQB8_9ASTE|nr:unnamed protein product [Cuscuta epithymum]